jgi:hypothetical protein
MGLYKYGFYSGDRYALMLGPICVFLDREEVDASCVEEPDSGIAEFWFANAERVLV